MASYNLSSFKFFDIVFSSWLPYREENKKCSNRTGLLRRNDFLHRQQIKILAYPHDAHSLPHKMPIALAHIQPPFAAILHAQDRMEATSVQHPGKFVACASGHCLFSSGLGDVGGEQPVQIGSDPDARAFEPIIEFYAMLVGIVPGENGICGINGLSKRDTLPYPDRRIGITPGNDLGRFDRAGKPVCIFGIGEGALLDQS